MMNDNSRLSAVYNLLYTVWPQLYTQIKHDCRKRKWGMLVAVVVKPTYCDMSGKNKAVFWWLWYTTSVYRLHLFNMAMWFE